MGNLQNANEGVDLFFAMARASEFLAVGQESGAARAN
jgi:hypothetical protein